ncbi:hypothetical protein SAMN02745751_02532 [Dethiosulfatibacter aminovorans DSM 17477]|uniref:Vitamin B12 dependent methionine synthase, activation domain n=1 Tax=Dethiosulfatibacter aminovorans DSM 17477 TaxID=1121476 RepID=A0A1M6J7F0_9FIRM|nr:hypothetical protein [Dethiosulfatibacter aminovorans]SHJ42601.1 hypothetical protein SAMN02745751_02532 [Dethiosulfatibacter aminovorans DSM 17477]
MKEVFKPTIKLDKKKIYTRIRVREDSPIYDTIDELYEKYVENIEDRIEFQVIYSVKPNEFNFDISDVDNCEKVVFCYATIGNPLNDDIVKLFDDKNYLEGYLLNEVANDIVMEATNQLYSYLKKRMKEMGYFLTKRYSPGECTFEMEYQKPIMEELEKDFDVNGELTESFMINPEKSTLYIYGADKNIPELEVDFDCSTCQSHNCPFRREGI